MPSAKPKQLLRFPLLWSIVLFLVPVPALGDIDSNCTVGDSPDGDALTLVPTCSANTAKLDVVFNESSDDSIEVRIDYVCIGNGNETIVGTPWSTYFSSPFPTTPTPSVNVRELQPEMNCTFYVCYERFTSSYSWIKGKATPASCIIDINECETANGGCEQMCSNTIGSFACSCSVGYRLDENGLNCTDIDECESDDLNNCHENAQCIDTEGSFNCSCNPGYTGDGVNCTNIDECERDDLNNCHENAQCIDTEGSFNCSCNAGYTGDGVNCTNIDECELGMHTCDSNAICTDTHGSFSCTCIDDLEGDGFNCTTLSSTGGGILPVVLAPTMLVVIIALLCGVICVVYQLKKEVKFEIMFYKNEKVDLDFYPVSPFSVPKPAASLVSIFDKLSTIPDSKPHFQDSDTDSDNQSEILETDPATKPMDNLVDNNSIGTELGTPENDDNCVANTAGQGYIASQAHQNMAGVSSELFVETDGHVFPVFKESESCVLEDAQNDDVCNSKMEPTIACNVVEKSSNYVHSDDLLVGSRESVSALNSNEHIPECDIPSLDNCVVSTNERGYVDSEDCQTMANASTGIFSRTENNIFLVSEEPVSLVLDFDEDGQNTKRKIELCSRGQVCPDSSASDCPSAIDRKDTGASNFVEQSSNYVRSEDLLEGSRESVSAFDLNDHIPKSDIPSLDNCVVSTNERGYVDSEACKAMASVSLDIPAAKCSIDQNDTIASNFVEQSSNYVRSEDLLEGSHGHVSTFNHILESDIPSRVMSTNERGYVDSEAHQNTTSVSPVIFVRTEDDIFPDSEEPVSLALDFDEDDQNSNLEIEPSCYGHVCNGPAFNCPSAIDQNDTGASSFVEQSSNYVRSEDLLEGSHESVSTFDLNDHIPESDIPSRVMSTNERGYVDSEACQTKAFVSLDIPAANFPSIVQNGTIASNFVEQSSNYVRSEDLLEGSRGFVPAFDHIPESDILCSDNSIMTTNKQGYVDSEACQPTASVSPELFIERECEESNFPASEEIMSLVLDLDEDSQNNNSEQEPTFGDIPASSRSSDAPGDHNETPTSNTENSDYIHTEDLLVGRHETLTSAFDLNDHISDSESLQFICLEDAADQQSLSTIKSKVEACYVPPKESSSYVSDTFLLPSAKVRPDMLCIQDPKALFIHSESEDNLSISTMSPQSIFSEQYRTLPHRNFGYSDDTAHNVLSSFTMQHPSTSSGYITDN